MGSMADEGSRVSIEVECHCPDPVGQKFCDTFKEKVRSSLGYRLADNNKGYGLGVHFASVDLWKGIDNKLADHMSAVSVTFTIYADTFPGEIYEDSSVFRVGKDAVPELADKVLGAVGQLVTMNGEFFTKMRSAAGSAGGEQSPAAEQSPAVEQSPAAEESPTPAP